MLLNLLKCKSKLYFKVIPRFSIRVIGNNSKEYNNKIHILIFFYNYNAQCNLNSDIFTLSSPKSLEIKL